jgi:hypothetical protein
MTKKWNRVLRHSSAALALLVCSSYSYSEEIFGTTQNAADALQWTMTEVLPQQAGLTVSNVIYRYTSVKQIEDDMLVHVQNQNAQAPGFIFRETDDWSGIPGNTINKVVPVQNIPIELWGDGSIEVEGIGEVTNASVFYSFQYEPCFDPQSDPTCPGYKDPFDMMMEAVDVYDPMKDQFIQDELDRKAVMDEEDEEDRQRRKMMAEGKKESNLEGALSIVNTALMTAEAQAKAAELMAMNFIPQTYYQAIPDTKYEETVVLNGGNIPDNNKGRRVGFAQQLLHEKMVDSQYNN